MLKTMENLWKGISQSFVNEQSHRGTGQVQEEIISFIPLLRGPD